MAIGQSKQRLDAEAKVTGRARYTDDMGLPGMRHAAYVHSTIAHGYLTLSLLPYMWQQIIEVNNLKMMVNYGMDDMKFGQPVITGSRVRLVATLHEIANLRGICKTSIKFDIEIEGQRKPALSGIATFLYYFK